MATGLVGTWLVGAQALWPIGGVALEDVFNRPSWERPTVDNPFDPFGEDTADEFTGSPVFTGGFETGGPGAGGATTGGTGFLGGGGLSGEYVFWTAGDPTDPRDGGAITAVQDDGVRTINIYASRLEFFRLEVRDPDGDLVSYIPKWISGTLTQQLDHASLLEFSALLTDEGVSDAVPPNQVWLRDRWGFIIDTFQVEKRAPNGNGDASYVTITAQGAISQLLREPLVEYDAEDTTVQAHVEALIALQQRSAPFTVGKIDKEIGELVQSLYVFDSNIHAALLTLQMALPKEFRGRIYVDAQRRIQWRMAPGDVTEQVITREANVRAINAEVDYTQLVNRIYMYGEGNDPASRLKLTDAVDDDENPIEEEYIEDSSSVSTYGLSPYIKIDRRIRYPETLYRIAKRVLEEFAEPTTVVEVELLDIAKADDAPVGWADIHIGGKYRVVDTALSVDSVVEIVKIERDLARPVPVRVELANQVKTLADLFARLIEGLQQPLDVDGNRYPTMGRNYSAQEPRAARAGDVRWNDGGDKGQMHDGDDWRDLADAGDIADAIWYTATTKAGLPNTDLLETALGRVTAGIDQGVIYIRNPANNGWVAVNKLE